MKLISKWLFGIIFLAKGLLPFIHGTTAILGALFFVVAGLICFPPLLNIIEKKINYKLESIEKYIIVIIGVLLGQFFEGMGKEDRLAANNESINSKTYSEHSSKDTIVAEQYYLLESVNDFKTNFNSYAKQANFEFRIKKIKIEEEMFSYRFNDRIEIIGQFNKNKKVYSVMMIGQGNGELESGYEILMTIGGVISGVNPKLTPYEKGEIIKELGILNSDAGFIPHTSIIKEGIKYSVSSSQELGMLFGIEVAKLRSNPQKM